MSRRKIVKILETNGWICVRVTGSHYQYKLNGIGTVATVPHHDKDISDFVVRSLCKSTGIDFYNYTK